MLDKRKKLILEAIIRYFTDKAIPVGSQAILSEFNVSSATIRSDMSFLEKEGFLYQPHTSAGRVPTEEGYRFFVDELMKPVPEKYDLQKKFESLKTHYYKNKAIDKIYDAVSILSECTQDISFATIPDNKRTYYIGIANLLKQPEFINNLSTASKVVEVLERGFLGILDTLKIEDKIKIFIGKENIIPEIQSCSMLAIKYQCHGFEGALGILGPIRMNYSYNTTALEFAYNMIQDEK